MESTRRDLLHTFLGASVAGWSGISGCGSYARDPSCEGQFVDPAYGRGHQLQRIGPQGQQQRDHFLRSETRCPAPTNRAEYRTEVLILGGGVSGLSAGWMLRREGVQDIVVLDLEAVPGGTSAGVASGAAGYPWGAHYLPAPQLDQPELVHFLNDAGCVQSFDEEGTPNYREDMRCVMPRERVCLRGMWQPGLVPTMGVAESSLAEVDRFFRRVRGYAGLRGEDARRVFRLPIAACSEDPSYLALDRYTFADWLDREKFNDPVVRWLANYATRDDYGASVEETSAWYGIHYHAARLLGPDIPNPPWLTWPEGNAYLVRHLAAGLGDGSTPEMGRPRFRGGCMVTRIWPSVAEGGSMVEVISEQGVERWWADRVIYALPSFLKPRLLAHSKDTFSLDTSAWMVANIHLHRRPAYMGAETAWDNVIYGSASLGYVVSTHQRGPYAGPTTWTWYLPLVGPDLRKQRRYLMSLTWKEAVEVVMSDLEPVHPDIRQCVRRIDVRRWGHAMPVPKPGVRTSAARVQAAQPQGVVHFAHTDLSGVALFEEAFFHGVRAAREVLVARAGARPVELR
ncbi:MAG: FAD-dependent oxidoreductase [Myxococcales bacterium]|nr:FAD-dependent oxidoreductase [Myxococcales bacterium]